MAHSTRIKIAAGIVLFFILVMMGSCLVPLAHGATKPIYCQKPVIQAMKTIWSKSGNGMTGREAAFVLDGDPSDFRLIMQKGDNVVGSTPIETSGQTFAVFHTHPNNSLPTPSTPENNILENNLGDTGVANNLQVDMYVISRSGLVAYFWRTKQVVWLRYNMEWDQEKGCQ